MYVIAEDLHPGDEAIHRPNPGSSFCLWVEVTKVVVERRHTHVWWRITNTTRKPFKTTYDLQESLSITRKPITEEENS